ncbi:MAG: hypothetical protein HY303_05405, partial [Candidatus Wallbacteria bacterium]|nr:hypothetical protein [Candidatus Wallbacteria bacterium]
MGQFETEDLKRKSAPPRQLPWKPPVDYHSALHAMVFFEKSFLALRFWLIKLGLAVLLALLASAACGVKDRLSPAFTALLCIRGTFFTGISVGPQQVLAALAGTTLSLLCNALFGSNDVALAISVMLAAYVCLRFNWESSTLLVLFTLLYSHLLPLGSLGKTAQIRVEGVLIGVVVASFVNYLFSHFRYRRMYYFRLRHALEHLHELLDGILDAMRRRNLDAVESQSQSLKSLARLVSLAAATQDDCSTNTIQSCCPNLGPCPTRQTLEAYVIYARTFLCASTATTT